MTSKAQTIETWGVMQPPRPWLIDFLARLRHHPLGMFGLIGVLLFFFLALTAQWVAPYDPTAGDYGVMQSPTLSHPFGTDWSGRDILSRVISATPSELKVGLTAVFVGVALATMLGLISGYLGGQVDSVLQRLVDAWLAFPPLILLLIISSALGPSAKSMTIALVIGVIPGTSRIIRSTVLAEKNKVYVEAAQVIGASQTRIMLRHILPQLVPTIIVMVSIAIPVIALLGAALSFLGMGTPQAVTWGGDLSGRASQFFTHAPRMAIFPGAAISLYVLSFNMLGDAMRDIFDPQLRGSAAMRG